VIDAKIDAVITGNMGPNAMELIKAAGIKIYSMSGGTVEGAVKLCLEGKLEEINQAAPAHSGWARQAKGLVRCRFRLLSGKGGTGKTTVAVNLAAERAGATQTAMWKSPMALFS
jgi:predicted Fe-Mo cluster-binding NifX family protein